MGRRSKLNFTSLFFKPTNINGGGGGSSTPSSSSTSSTSSASSWAWPSCKQAPRTDSFGRSGPVHQGSSNMFKTLNSVYLDSTDASLFSSSDIDDTLSEPDEAVIRGLLRSDRLLFEPGAHASSSILPPAPKYHHDQDILTVLECDDDDDIELVPFKESVAMAVESSDPYWDFRRSMEEMVAAHGMTRRREGSWPWECLEDLLVCYLNVNGKNNHGFIVAAFVDLLLSLNLAAAAAADDSSHSDEIKGVDAAAAAASSSSNSTMSSYVSFEIEEVQEEEGVDLVE